MTSERRQEPRFQIVLPVMLDDTTVGQTQDVSASGIYVTFRQAVTHSLLLGSSIRIEMLLAHASPDGPVQVACDGEVIRVDRRGEEIGIAARITSYRFAAGEDL